MKRKSIVLAAIVVIGAMLACNLPFNTPNQPNPDAVLTAAALTVQAQLTTSAPTISPANTATSAPSVSTPTLTPVPVSTSTSVPVATATTSCDKGLFVTDVSYPDDTSVPASTNFTKTWRLQNIGSCSWTPSYAVVFMNGNIMSGPTVQALSGNVNPGQTVDISVNLQAPSSNGTYTGNWGLRNPSGVIFTHFYLRIKVNGGGGPFAVTSVNYTLSTWSNSGHTNCPRVIAHITANGAGTVTYHWIRSDGGSTSTYSLTYGSAGTQSTNYDWALPHVWNGTTEWVGIYVDSPNHQGFGHLSFTTACTSP
jgi:hypothetical protein